MLSLGVLVSLLTIAASKSVEISKRSSVCYHDIGCFDTAPPFFSLQRPLNFLPMSPDRIKVKFMLYTKQNLDNVFYLSAAKGKDVHNSHFNPHKPTKMIMHGFIDTGKEPWLHTMKDEFLKNHDYNVIIVDWGGGSAPPYTQATANTRVVGAVIAQLIKYLKAETGAKPEDFHLLGHSLGSHVAGYAGERIQHVGRITGLDPAEPYFQGTDIKVRLDPTDALFVDVIHTDGESMLKLGYGMSQPCGHVDYFPNGGMTQPGCDKGPITQIQIGGVVEGAKQFVACNHLRSYALFTESINAKCPFEAFRCSSYSDFNSGKCMPCSGGACGYMGFHADRVKPTNHQTLVKYYLKTGSNGPFCRYHYQVHLTMANYKATLGRTETGYVYAHLTGTKGQTRDINLSENSIQIAPGHSYNFIAISETDLGDISRFSFRWEHDSHWYKPLDWNILGLRHPQINIAKVDVVNGESDKVFHFCGGSGIETSTTKELSRC